MDISLFFKILGLIIFAYLLGSIPWGLVLTKYFSAVNLLEQGSGNIGATNVRRLAGPHLGLLTLVGDILKGLFPVLVATQMVAGGEIVDQVILCSVAMASFMGHLFPIYLRFKNGGKGVATALGCFLAIAPWACILSLVTFVIAIWVSNRVSIGSLCAAAVLPLSVYVVTKLPLVAVFAFVMASMIFVRHKGNIERILKGTEPVIWKKRK